MYTRSNYYIALQTCFCRGNINQMLEWFKIIDNYDKKFQYEILIKCMNGLRYL